MTNTESAPNQQRIEAGSVPWAAYRRMEKRAKKAEARVAAVKHMIEVWTYEQRSIDAVHREYIGTERERFRVSFPLIDERLHELRRAVDANSWSYKDWADGFKHGLRLGKEKP